MNYIVVKLFVIACDPECSFKNQSHNEQEVSSIAKKHAKGIHNMEATDDKIKSLIKITVY